MCIVFACSWVGDDSLKWGAWIGLHIVLCFFSGIGQAGDSPGLAATAEETLHTMFSQMHDSADVGHHWQSTGLQVFLPQIHDDRPVIRPELTQSVHFGEKSGGLTTPAFAVDQKAVFVEVEWDITASSLWIMESCLSHLTLLENMKSLGNKKG
jgi:hypothetical protein